MIGHGRWRREVVDELLGLLAPDRSDALGRHLEGCGTCREEREVLQRTLRLAADPAPRTAPPIDLAAMLARVDAEIDRRVAGPARVRPRLVALWLPAAMAAALVLFIARPRSTPPETPDAGVSAVALRQMERTVNREQTARYLQEAQGVLLSVASTLPRCERVNGRRVGPEAEKSRELLARRRLLVDAEAEHLAMARPVLEDVDRALGEVASLDRCAGAAELRALARRIAEERLLLKIGLMARELQG